MRPVELVRRAGEEVAADRLDVDEHVRRVVHRVDEDERADARAPARAARATSVMVPSALDAAPMARSFVRGVIAASRSLQSRRPSSVRIFTMRTRDAAILRERAPRRDVAVVIELGDDDLVALAPLRGRARARGGR